MKKFIVEPHLNPTEIEVIINNNSYWKNPTKIKESKVITETLTKNGFDIDKPIDLKFWLPDLAWTFFQEE